MEKKNQQKKNKTEGDLAERTASITENKREGKKKKKSPLSWGSCLIGIDAKMGDG